MGRRRFAIRFTLGGTFALIALVCGYLTTGLFAVDPLVQSMASIVNPLLLLLAIVAWFDPGRVNRIFISIARRAATILKLPVR